MFPLAVCEHIPQIGTPNPVQHIFDGVDAHGDACVALPEQSDSILFDHFLILLSENVFSMSGFFFEM